MQRRSNREEIMKNVILLTIDTLRKDVLGCYNAEGSLTPFMDSIQQRCIRFLKANATGPYTQASFPGILTSSYYLEYGKSKNLPAQKTMISEVLKDKGILTACFHSNPYLSDFFGYNRGWDTFYDSMDDEVSDMYPFIRGDGINHKVTHWLSNHIKDRDYKPFFLWIHYMDVHEPYIPEGKWLDKVDSSIDLTKEEMYGLFKDVILKRDASNEETVDILRKLYNAKVLETDSYVRDIFSFFEESRVLEESIIIIGSDHGDEFGEHGGLSHDGKMYRELIEVPLFIYDSAREEEWLYDNPVSNIDISPTIARLFGFESVKGWHGASLLPLDGHPEKGCFGEAIDKSGHREKDTDRPVYFYREKDIKIIYRECSETWELYDIRQDPDEWNNIIDTSPDAEHLKDKLKDIKEKTWSIKDD